MNPARLSLAVVALVLLSCALAGCNAERMHECEQFLSAMRPLSAGTPNADSVDRVRKDVDGIRFEDTPLDVYAKNYSATLTVLSNTLKLREGPEPPDGTDEAVASNLKEARTDTDDVSRYCSR